MKYLLLTIVTVALATINAQAADTAIGQPKEFYRMAPQFVGSAKVDSSGAEYPKGFVIFAFVRDSIRIADSASSRDKGQILYGVRIWTERRTFVLLSKDVYGRELTDTIATDRMISVPVINPVNPDTIPRK